MLEKERQSLDLDLGNSTDPKLQAKDERQIEELRDLHQRELELQAQIREEHEACKDIDKQVSINPGLGLAPFFVQVTPPSCK